MRATIVVSLDAPQEVAEAEAWFSKWRPHLVHCSQADGGEGSVHIWHVDGPGEAVAEIPQGLSAMSDWSHPRPSNAKADRALEQKLANRQHRAQDKRRR